MRDGPSADPAASVQADEGNPSEEELTRGNLPIDFDSYIPMPIPDPRQAGTSSGPGQAISYDIATGTETIHESNAAESSQESGQVAGTLGAYAELLSEVAPELLEVERGFTNLSLVDDPELFPWRVNCKIYMNFSGSHYVASGVLIDSMHVLTAGHCVYNHDEGGWATSIRVVPAYENGSKPYGEAFSVQLHSWTGWTSDESYSHDIGVIDLNRPVGALTGWYGYGYNTSETFFLSNTFHNPGYPAESPYDGQYMYYWHGDFDYFIPFTNMVGIWQAAYGGQSGSGAYYKSGDSRTVYAVLSNGTSSAENFIRLTENKFEDIRDNFIAGDTPSTFDLIPLDVNISPGTVDSASALSSMSYTIHNYSSVSWSGTANVSVYLSTDNNITTSDTVIQTHSFTQSISAKGTTTINVPTPPTIPAGTATGNYYIGIILNVSDHSTGNNDTDGWDAAPIHVNFVNHAPIISGLPNVNLDEDASRNNAIDLWVYASDLETSDGNLTYTIVGNTNPNCGVSIDTVDYVDISPAANWNGTSDVTIRVTDPQGLYDEDTFRITVNPVNDAPVVSGLPDIDLEEDTSLNNAIHLWAYASDVETSDGNLTYTIVGNTDPDCGVSIDSNDYVDINPTVNWSGTSDVTIRVTDPQGLYDEDTFRITVGATNDPPVVTGLPDINLDEDTSLNNAIHLWVYASDSETSDGNLTYAIVANTNPDCGVSIDASDYVDVSPATNWNGTSDVMVRVTDPQGSYDEDTFRITVNPVNDTPVAVNDTYGCDEDTTLIKYTHEGVLINDSDPDNDVELEAVLQSGPLHGTLNLNERGWFTYHPDQDYYGTDSFTYQAFDGTAYSNTVTVTLDIASVNDPPVAVDDAYEVDENDVLNTHVHNGVLANDTDADNTDHDPEHNDTLTVVPESGPAHGNLTLNPTGWFTYTPHDDYHGTDSFTYKVNDGTDDSNTATVTLDIASINDVPVAVDDAYQVDEDTTLLIYAYEGVLANDSDADNEDSDPDNDVALEAVPQSDPLNGTLTLNSNGSFTYIPDTNYYGTDSFTYRASDGEAFSEPATVLIEVVGVLDIPGDATGDGKVDAEDAERLASNWGQQNATWEMGDFDDDGIVGPYDVAILAANWGATAESSIGEEESSGPSVPSGPATPPLIGPVQANPTGQARQLIEPATRLASEQSSPVGQAVPDIPVRHVDLEGDSPIFAAQKSGQSPAAHDAVLAEEYGPQLRQTSLQRERLAWSHAMARRQLRQHDEAADKDTARAIDLLLWERV